MRIRLELGYDGTDFAGWAAQPGLRTVEGELSAALTTLLRAPEPVRLVVAGRTDAGVHARGQVSTRASRRRTGAIATGSATTSLPAIRCAGATP